MRYLNPDRPRRMSAVAAPRSLHLPARYLAIVQDILRRYLPRAEVWANWKKQEH